MPPRFLLTGFKPFGDLTANPTEQLMHALASAETSSAAAEIETLVLDVDYTLAETQFRAAVERLRPDAILSFGVAGGADELRLERIAVNLDDAGLPDSGGRLRSGTRIVEQGPTRGLFASPSHPYTASLLSAVPVPEPDRDRQRILLSGEPPSPIDPPAGCPFHPRCPVASSRCETETPVMTEQAPGHVAACHHPGELAVEGPHPPPRGGTFSG